MNLYIAPVNALIFLIACLMGCIVYRRTRSTTAAQGSIHGTGDLATAVTVAAAVVLVLAFLLGVVDGKEVKSEGPRHPATTSPSVSANP
ncbi:hypothetical protein [Streptomyces sp. XY332]|uniref:hypothetical protein n=1 Tax=Streptomyces sp. XY332 TaxID=1415561 RepID=UPI000AB2DF3E|nr:hypothetical protein [Streptomyces sp. XY332]